MVSGRMLLLFALLALAAASDGCLPTRSYGYHEGACVYREVDSYGEPQMHGAPTHCCEEAQDSFQLDEYTADLAESQYGNALLSDGIVGEALTPSPPRVLAAVNDYESSSNVVPSVAGEYNIELPGAGEQSLECPGPFHWNKAASRCQRLIASGNTQFIKTACCKELIEGAEERSGYDAAVLEDALINTYEGVREEEKQISGGGCIRKCYFKKNAKAEPEQINCDELGRYEGTRECKRNNNVVPCDQLTCVNEVAIEDDAPPPSTERTCRRVCYYRAYPGARTKKRIPCTEVDTKYVGDKACTRNGETVACDTLKCPE